MEFLCFNFSFCFLIYYFGCEAGGVSVSSLNRGLNPGHRCESLKDRISNQLATRELHRPLLKCKCPGAGLRRTHRLFLGESVEGAGLGTEPEVPVVAGRSAEGERPGLSLDP